ncbi:MAG: signal peptidase I [Coriobacteriia bacterium]|nr:signal peptidase I [Coriobacteriia bacterium]
MQERRVSRAGLLVRRLLGLCALGLWAAVAAKYGATVVRGASMEPALVPGDVAVYVRGSGPVRTGDVVLFAHEGWPSGVLHRVVARLPGGLLKTKGDACSAPDRDPLPRTRIRGVVCTVVPTGRWLQYAAERIRGCAILNRQSKSATR